MSKEQVWVVPDPSEEVYSSAGKKSKKNMAGARPREAFRDPATAFIFSVLIWGGGQLYHGRKKIGFLFLLLMLDFYSSLGLVWFYWSNLTVFLAAHQITPFDLLIVCGIFYSCGLSFWFATALQAYFTSTGRRRAPKEEEPSLWPPFASIVVPGWGQLLNGQGKKGVFFFLATLPAILATTVLIALPRLWEIAERPTERLLAEKVLLAAVAALFLFFFVWIFGIYDAGKISLDPDRKEPIFKRMKYALNRARMKGWRGMVPYLKFVLMLVLFLTFCLSYSYYYFPKRFYIDQLHLLQKNLSGQGMVLIPRVIDRSLRSVSPPKNQK